MIESRPSFGNYKNSEEEFESLLSSFTTNKNYLVFGTPI